jgi:sirohydrochlorin ferrochelatase
VEAEEWDCGEQRDQDEEEVVAVVKWTICVVELQKERFTRSSAACTCSALGCKWRGVYIYITSASEETKGAGPSAGPTRHGGTRAGLAAAACRLAEQRPWWAAVLLLRLRLGWAAIIRS